MTKRSIRNLVGFATPFFFFLLSFSLWAAEEGQGGHGGGWRFGGLFFSTINFVIFAAILRKYALPAVRDTIRQRRDTIVQALNEAKRAKAEAEALRAEYEQKLAGLAAEQQRLQTQALEAAEREKSRILEEARRGAERLQSEARQIAQRELAEARRVLRQEVAEQAVRLATELVTSRLNQNDQRRFVQNLVAEVNNAANPSR
ncbi:MAG: ATP synthase F0 subunit B [Deltaproteobacteria bacterium]|nr:ATP synthase F0 subunit B [Deltaproteobacteria bacterium]